MTAKLPASPLADEIVSRIHRLPALEQMLLAEWIIAVECMSDVTDFDDLLVELRTQYGEDSSTIAGST